MSKKKFFNALINEIEFLDLDDINSIINEYEDIINSRIKNGEKLKDVIKSFGDVNVLAKKILKDRRRNKIDIFKNKINSFLKKLNFRFKKLFYKRKNNIKKNKKSKKIKINKKRNFKYKFNSMLKNLKNYLLKLVSKYEKIKNKILKRNEKNKKSKLKKKTVRSIENKKNNWIKNLIVYLLIIIFFLNNVIFFVTVIGYIDGVKILGLPLSFGSLSILYIFLILIIDEYYNFYKLSKSIKFSIGIIVFLLLSFSIALFVYESYNINYINDPTVKYTPVKSTNKITVSEKTKNYNIYFNSFYKPNYSVVIDDTLNDIIKVEVKYFECMSDLIYKTSRDSVYISLTENKRDLVSFYIENLKENIIYNYKELTRNEIIIYMSKKISEKVKIHN